MSLKQISVFLENRPGRLQSVARILGDADCSILAFSMADTQDFGILRLIMDDVDKAAATLRGNGFSCQIGHVTAVGIGSAPGSLSTSLDILTAVGVNVEYAYAMAEPRSTHPILIYRFDKPEAAVAALKNAGYHVYEESEILGADK